MNICVRGLASVYEPENVARLFFANARLVRRLPRKEDAAHPLLLLPRDVPGEGHRRLPAAGRSV